MERFALKDENRKYRTEESLWEEALDELEEALDDLDIESALELGNSIREDNHYEPLRRNTDNEINDALRGVDPWDILTIAGDWDDYSDFFIWDGYDLYTTDDVWYDLDTADIAREILRGYYDSGELPDEIQEIYDEYLEAVEKLNNINKERIEGENLLQKFVNCEADVTDLLQYIDRLVKNDEVWKEEE